MIVALALALLTPAAGRPCATIVVHDAVKRGFPMADVGIGERPVDIAGFVDSATNPIRVHYGEGVDVARATLVRDELDIAYALQVSAAGFPPPLSDGAEGGDDRFDAYVVPLPPGTGALTIALADASDSDGRHASPSFMKIDANLDDGRLRAFAHHEFQHALQFAIDVSESLMWFESTAVFWEVTAQPDVDDWLASLPSFQANPHAPIFTHASAFSRFSVTADRYEYGAVLFAIYLDEVYGSGTPGVLLRELWEASVQADDVDENEPDWLDALDDRQDVSAILTDFVGWRALVGTLDVPSDGPAQAIPNDGELVVGGVSVDALDGRSITTPEAQSPFQHGCAVREVAAPQSVDTLPLTVDAQPVNAGRELAFAYLVTTPGSGSALREQPATVPYALEAPGGAFVQLAFCDVTAADADDDPEPQPIRFSLLRTDIDFPDAGFPEPDAGVVDLVDAGVPPDEMCNCQSTDSNAPSSMRRGLMTFGVLVTFLVVLIRGARMWKRKRLYRRDDAQNSASR